MSVHSLSTRVSAFRSPISSLFTQQVSGFQAFPGGELSARNLNSWGSNSTGAVSHSPWATERLTKLCKRGFLDLDLMPAATSLSGTDFPLHTQQGTGAEELQAGVMGKPDNLETERIQVLDMKEYFSGDSGRVAKFCENLREQCHTVGFFYVKNHGVPLELCDSFLQLGREFFDLPSELKTQLDYRKSAQFRGYMRIGVENTGGITDFREQLDLGPEEAEDFDIIDGKAERLVHPLYRRLRGPNQWPPEHALPGFKPAAEDFTARMGTLGIHLMQAIAVSLGLRKEYFDSTFHHYQMKVVRYPPKSESEDAETLGMFGVGEHSDSSFLSLLLQDSVGGLQAQTPAGEWTDVPPKVGTIVVNLGEMVQLATGGYYMAAVHRVQSQKGSISRYSVPFFFNPKLDTNIMALTMAKIPEEADLPFQHGLLDNSLWKVSKTHSGANQLIPVFGQNTFKSYARSHPNIVQEHHPDLLQSDGTLAMSKLEEIQPTS